MPLLNRLLLPATLVLSLALSWILFDTMRERKVATGDKAPSFSVTTKTGRTLSRSDFGGKVLVLNFWASWCPPCVEEMPYLDQIQQQYGPKGVVVLGISIDKNKDAYDNFLRRFNPSFDTTHDPSAQISYEYGTFRYPETYIIDASGVVREKIDGRADQPVNGRPPLAEILNKLL